MWKRFQSDHSDHDGWSGYNVTGNIGTGADSELISRLWCARVTARCCKSHLHRLAWDRSLLRLVGNNVGKPWNFISGCCLLPRRRAGLRVIPSGQTSPSEEGFANLQKPVIYPDIHLNIGCDKVRGDVHVMIAPTTDAAGGEWRVRRGLASFSFLIFHLVGRAQGLAPAHPLEGKKYAWTRKHKNKTAGKPFRFRICAVNWPFWVISNVAPRWHRGVCAWIIHLWSVMK